MECNLFVKIYNRFIDGFLVSTPGNRDFANEFHFTLHDFVNAMKMKSQVLARYSSQGIFEIFKIFGNGPQPCSSDSNPVFGFWNSDYFKKRWIVASSNLLKQVGFRVATKLLCWTWSVTGLIFFSGAKTFPIAKNVAYNGIKSVLEKLFKV